MGRIRFIVATGMGKRKRRKLKKMLKGVSQPKKGKKLTAEEKRGLMARLFLVWLYLLNLLTGSEKKWGEPKKKKRRRPKKQKVI